MTNIKRYEINKEWAHSGIIEAGDFVFSAYCVGGNRQETIDRTSKGRLTAP